MRERTGRKLIKTVSISEIVPLHQNPPSRTSDKDRTVSAIVEYIETRRASGMSPLPATERLLIGSDGVLGDGHRRLAALKKCGVTEIEVEIDEERTGVEIWRDRANAKPPTSRQVAEAGARGLGIEMYPAAQRRNAEKIIRLAGIEGLNHVIQTGTSLGIHHEIPRLLSFLSRTNDNVSPL